MQKFHIKYGKEKTRNNKVNNTFAYKEFFEFYLDMDDGLVKPAIYAGPELDISASKDTSGRRTNCDPFVNTFTIYIGDSIVGEGRGVRYLEFSNIKKREWKKAMRLIKKFNPQNIDITIEKI